jgi:hypothetical protein
MKKALAMLLLTLALGGCFYDGGHADRGWGWRGHGGEYHENRGR